MRLALAQDLVNASNEQTVWRLCPVFHSSHWNPLTHGVDLFSRVSQEENPDQSSDKSNRVLQIPRDSRLRPRVCFHEIRSKLRY